MPETLKEPIAGIRTPGRQAEHEQAGRCPSTRRGQRPAFSKRMRQPLRPGRLRRRTGCAGHPPGRRQARRPPPALDEAQDTPGESIEQHHLEDRRGHRPRGGKRQIGHLPHGRNRCRQHAPCQLETQDGGRVAERYQESADQPRQDRDVAHEGDDHAVRQQADEGHHVEIMQNQRQGPGGGENRHEKKKPQAARKAHGDSRRNRRSGFRIPASDLGEAV